MRVAADALGEDVAREEEPAFATTRMVFVELCPYASRRFVLAPDVVADLARTDPGFLVAAEFRDILIREGCPALILVNGNAAITTIETLEPGRVRWNHVPYESADPARDRAKLKKLWHKEGVYTAGNVAVPIVGFPFLKKPRTHNCNVEVAQLGAALRKYLASPGYSDQGGVPV